MAVSGNQLTRIRAAISGIGIKLTILAKAVGIPVDVPGLATTTIGRFKAHDTTGTMKVIETTGTLKTHETTGRFK